MTADAQYNRMVTDREPFLTRARECAKYTIPALVPPNEHSSHSRLNDTFQSMGARGVNNLSSKLLMALFPPNSPFFKLQISTYELEKLTGEPELQSQVEEALGQVERTVQGHIESQALRTTLFEAFKLLVVSGNVLIYIDPKGGARLWKLDSYVCERDAKGNLLKVIATDSVAVSTLDNDIREALGPHLQENEKEVTVYTVVERSEEGFKTYQEIKGERIKGSEGEYKASKVPFLALRWSKIDGESYGRSFIEEYLGDLKSLEGLSKAMVDGAAAASKVLFLVRSGGQTRIRTITDAPNLAVRQGDANDVSVLQVGKGGDFNTALTLARDIQERLAQAFLLTASIQRNAERVTAEEIRLMASELEDALGGVYSVMAQELQLPLVTVLLGQLTKTKAIPPLPNGTVEPKVIAGLDALGRGHELQRLQTMMGTLLNTLGPEVVSQYVNAPDLIRRIGTAMGVDMAGLVKSQEQLMQEQQQKQQQAMMDQAMGSMVGQVAASDPQPMNNGAQ